MLVAIGDCGLMLEPQQGMSVKEIIDWGAYAERHGYGYIFRSDHLLPTNGNMDRDSVECWVTLGALAATTKRIKFGPMIIPIRFRNPVLLAQMACAPISYSKGRLLLGVLSLTAGVLSALVPNADLCKDQDILSCIQHG